MDWKHRSVFWTWANNNTLQNLHQPTLLDNRTKTSNLNKKIKKGSFYFLVVRNQDLIFLFPCRFSTDGKLVTAIRRNKVTEIKKAKLSGAEEKRKCACPSPVIRLTHYRQPARVSASNVPSLCVSQGVSHNNHIFHVTQSPLGARTSTHTLTWKTPFTH